MSNSDAILPVATNNNSPAKRHLDEHAVPDGEPKRFRPAVEEGRLALADIGPDHQRNDVFPKWDVTKIDQPVDRREFRRVGPYILGPRVGNSPVDSIVQYLAKKEGSDQFVLLKVSVDDVIRAQHIALWKSVCILLLRTDFDAMRRERVHHGVAPGGEKRQNVAAHRTLAAVDAGR